MYDILRDIKMCDILHHDIKCMIILHDILLDIKMCDICT